MFPSSPFSDFEDSEDEAEKVAKGSRAGSRAPSVHRKGGALQREASVASEKEFKRHRSRSLSVSLAQDEANQRANVVESKRTLSREISMSMAFKEKAKPRPKVNASHVSQHKKPKALPTIKDVGVTLIAETPAKRKYAEMQIDSQGANALDQSFRFKMGSSVPSPPPTSSSPGDILIEDTPLVARVLPKASSNLRKMDILSPLSPLSPVDEREETRAPGKLKNSAKPPIQFSRSTSDATSDGGEWLDENADESFTGSFGSPDVLLLGSEGDAMVTSSPLVALKARASKSFGLKPLGSRMSSRLDGGDVEMETPTKKRARRK